MVEILRRKLEVCETDVDGLIALSTIYGVDIQGDNVIESRKRLYAMYQARFGDNITAAEILRRNIIWADSLKFQEYLIDMTWDDALRAYKMGEQHGEAKAHLRDL